MPKALGVLRSIIAIISCAGRRLIIVFGTIFEIINIPKLRVELAISRSAAIADADTLEYTRTPSALGVVRWV